MTARVRKPQRVGVRIPRRQIAGVGARRVEAVLKDKLPVSPRILSPRHPPTPVERRASPTVNGCDQPGRFRKPNFCDEFNLVNIPGRHLAADVRPSCRLSMCSAFAGRLFKAVARCVRLRRVGCRAMDTVPTGSATA